MDIDKLVLKLSQELKQRNLKVAVAESCTGGGLAYYMTKLAGSSDWFERGFVTYSNQSKMDLLNVQEKTLEKFGAVSAETAAEMAEGVLKNSQAQLSIAITGIAGPSGGTADKPVGTVWFGLPNQPSQHEIFSGTREDIRIKSIHRALELLLSLLYLQK